MNRLTLENPDEPMLLFLPVSGRYPPVAELAADLGPQLPPGIALSAKSPVSEGLNGNEPDKVFPGRDILLKQVRAANVVFLA